MAAKLLFGRDIAGNNAYAPYFSQNKYSATLTSGVEETVTVPSDYENWIVAFSFEPGTLVWVALNETAEVPVGGTFATTTSELNPAARMVNAGDVLHLITDSTTSDVGVQLYAVS